MGDFFFPGGKQTSSKSGTSKPKKDLGGMLKEAGQVMDGVTANINRISGANKAVDGAKTSGWGLAAPLLGLLTGVITLGTTFFRDSRPLIEKKMNLGFKERQVDADRFDRRLADMKKMQPKQRPLQAVKSACSIDGECIDLGGNMKGYECEADTDTGKKVCHRRVDGKVFKETAG